ncbi:hypothetical protein PYS60_00990 [Amygdalobacter indicium]|nr:hypothetical protein [Amygdalobacter indicium]WEG34529.1 hypothetical protein PYS60_00990 [Amygdalobacter indicium]
MLKILINQFEQRSTAAPAFNISSDDLPQSPAVTGETVRLY